ncbi:MAG: hypothetical protein GYA55_03765 [SAR324 cluster bacterium]|uniref:Uncharacterized protein n=1 Tax=SAR324 cluster bacterium TaxID=2024889 RepID=A0A7X9IJP2_9DELT|nr:hypothetical protein [SAR324 cluster bacterium]
MGRPVGIKNTEDPIVAWTISVPRSLKKRIQLRMINENVNVAWKLIEKLLDATETK